MQIRVVLLLTAILSLYTANYAQSLLVDLDTLPGIQNTFTTKDTAATVGVAIRLTGVTQISGYEFKVSFDTTKFTFVGAQQDFGMTGEKNILTKNSGSIIGIAQLQSNPPAKDTVEFSYSITSYNSSTLVTGDGLAGVLYLKSRLPLGDSSAISVSNCILTDFDLNPTPVNVYNKGTYLVLPVTWSIRQHKYNFTASSGQFSTVTFSILNSLIKFDLPHSALSNNEIFTVAFYTLSGKYLAEYKMIANKNNFYSFNENNNSIFNQSGRYLCSLNAGSKKYSQVVTIR
ncbi:MAG TPA: hypothetical protein VHO70_10310 [Chitinispirillaceae bacterium]|nr:hypothetical protein [Chitinispirillaceae bacterium]